MSQFIKKHKSAITGTITFHAVIIAIFMFFGYTTPLPLPAEEGILINFGDNESGAGNEEPKLSESIQQEIVEESQESVTESTPTPSDEGAITQDYEDAPAIEEQGEKEEQKETKPEIKPEPKKEEVKEVVKVERKVNEQALFPGRDRNSDSKSSEGKTQGENNQGSATGSVDSKNHASGSSTGTDGTSFSLAGRNPVGSLPIPEYNYQEEGKVVVQISVDKYGKVTNAITGYKGSTTLDANLLAAAKRAALKATFNKKPDAPAIQKGTITYFFKLQQ